MTKARKTSRDQQTDAAPASWDEGSESFGSWLRSQREVRDIDLREISEDSKISMTYLEAFEQDRFDILPAPVFARGFLRHYARYVGLDDEEVVNFYDLARRRFEGENDDDEPELDAPRSNGVKLGALALSAVVVVLVLIWALTRGPFADSADSPTPPAPVEEGASGAPPGLERPDAGGPADGDPADGDPADGDPADGDPAPAAADVASDRPTAGNGLEPQPAPPLRLTLDFSGECWVEASVDGVHRVAENRVQGESLILEATSVVELKVGNVDVVDVEINGHPFEFEEVPGTKVRTQRFDLETVLGAGAGRG